MLIFINSIFPGQSQLGCPGLYIPILIWQNFRFVRFHELWTNMMFCYSVLNLFRKLMDAESEFGGSNWELSNGIIYLFIIHETCDPKMLHWHFTVWISKFSKWPGLIWPKSFKSSRSYLCEMDYKCLICKRNRVIWFLY